jgi:hypothetical protein
MLYPVELWVHGRIAFVTRYNQQAIHNHNIPSDTPVSILFAAGLPSLSLPLFERLAALTATIRETQGPLEPNTSCDNVCTTRDNLIDVARLQALSQD